MKNKKIVVRTWDFIAACSILAFLVCWFSLWGLKMYADEVGADGAVLALVETAKTTTIGLGSLALILISTSKLSSMSKDVRLRITIPGVRRRRS